MKEVVIPFRGEDSGLIRVGDNTYIPIADLHRECVRHYGADSVGPILDNQFTVSVVVESCQ